MSFRLFKVTMYVVSSGDTDEVFMEQVERSIFDKKDKLVDFPYILHVNKISAEEETENIKDKLMGMGLSETLLAKHELANKIEKFLDKYASKDKDGDWTSPDACVLAVAAVCLKHEGSMFKIKCVPWSEWGSGGYKPYTSKIGKKEHEFLLKEISKYVEKE